MTGSRKLNIPDDPGRRGVVGIAVRDDGRFLVIRRSRHVVAPGMYCFPGGGIEGDESEAEALVREFHEEVGARVEPVRRAWQCVTDWKVELSWWHVRLADGGCLRANQAEVERIEWFSAGEMAALPNLLPSNYDFLAGLLDGSICLDGLDIG
ncbi:MAG: NUDIX domain-containing protein [Planctomycetota bacterium]|nr:NUDIX domain-containing protein [Planctomycetota bacterium]